MRKYTILTPLFRYPENPQAKQPYKQKICINLRPGARFLSDWLIKQNQDLPKIVNH
jgi:hypothetical protein